MTDVTLARVRSSGRTATVVVLAVIGVLAVIACVIYLAEPARSLPGVLGTITHPASRADAHRAIRGWVSLAVGVVFLAAAGLASRTGTSSPR